ncbi:10203_t:CDS:1 [Funneliformis mosseae]|uniref:10203_t:CDS:1 n=1 Tax=Funneliformis mosseae TaxID=27381 RepID=A0A9N9D3B2_FUNMO|nr:10203_t:CDS:1 [Funneliformis mosseae]
MKSINNQRLILLPRPERWGKRYLFGEVKGQPDVIRCNADYKQLFKQGGASQVLSIIEIKPDQLMRQLLDNGLDLYEAYNRALTAADDELLCLLNIKVSSDS